MNSNSEGILNTSGRGPCRNYLFLRMSFRINIYYRLLLISFATANPERILRTDKSHLTKNKLDQPVAEIVFFSRPAYKDCSSL